jgi:uncharacterized protein YoxC
MDAIQILLIIILILSTFFLTIIGIQLFITLRALRNTLSNVDRVVKGFEDLGIGLSQGMNEVTGFMNGFKVILKAINIISATKHESSKK